MLDLITVVFRDELPLLETQAQSIDLYIKSTDLNQITVIVNDDAGIADSISTKWWGKHHDRVVIKVADQYPVKGWESQQLLKLLHASTSTAPWSMILDAKTWFIKPLEIDKLFDRFGRPCTSQMPGNPKFFIEARQFVQNYYQIEMSHIIGPNGVPFMFHTDTVKSLINSVDDFADFFCKNVVYPNLITEFFLYSGYVLHKFRNYTTLYNTSRDDQYLWAENLASGSSNEQFAGFIKAIKTQQNTLTVSIHRNLYNSLSQENLSQWCNFLQEKQLFCNILKTQNN